MLNNFGVTSVSEVYSIGKYKLLVGMIKYEPLR